MNTKALAIVAHPDDCIIFALPFIEQQTKFNWHIAYLTYTHIDPRAQEVSKFWKQRNVTTEFLGFVDDYKDQQTQQLNFWNESDAVQKIQSVIYLYQPCLILTHNKDGDYGHIHHKTVYNAVSKSLVPQIYFASTFNVTDICQAKDYDVDSLPLHKEVITSFQDRLIGRYIITDQARDFL
jgi:LmbE family N-acetylglucosaminyl deacetylase